LNTTKQVCAFQRFQVSFSANSDDVKNTPNDNRNRYKLSG